MLKEMGFYRGINLGGWMSQCDYSIERLENFIAERDIALISSWGLDHVRLPVDYNVLETVDGSAYLPEGFARINKAIDWCRKYGLNLVIDLHKTAGFSFDEGEQETGFFSDVCYQERFYRLWEEIARRCGGDPEHVAFELLNEVTDPAFMDTWNEVSNRCVQRIRQIAPDHLILIGGYHNNSALAVPALAKPADSKVIYNFHCYDPIQFTHQGAPWVKHLDQSVRMTFEEVNIQDDYFDKLFSSALEAASKNGTELYCGEYGVIDRTDPEEALKWMKLIHDTFEKHGIARCLWSYKEMDFGLADSRLDSIRERWIALL